MLSVVIPSYRRNEDLARCLQSLRANSSYENEVIVLSPDPEADLVGICRQYSAILHQDGSRSKGRRVKTLWEILNYGIDLAGAEFVCWLNDDCMVNRHWDSTAMGYFEDQVGLVVLRTKGINQSQGYSVLTGYYGFACANYAILRKGIGVRFDPAYNWFFGDADISLQIARSTAYSIVGTREDLIVHEHRMDVVRTDNESDPRAKQDSSYFYRKWRFMKRVDDRLRPMSVLEIVRAAAQKSVRFIRHQLTKLQRS